MESHGNVDFSKISEELRARVSVKRSKEIVNVCSQKVTKVPDEIDYIYSITECLFEELRKPARYVKN